MDVDQHDRPTPTKPQPEEVADEPRSEATATVEERVVLKNQNVVASTDRPHIVPAIAVRVPRATIAT